MRSIRLGYAGATDSGKCTAGSGDVVYRQALMVGPYRIGMAVPEGIHFSKGNDDGECAPVELAVARQKQYHVPPVSFLGFRWIVIVGVVNDAIVGIRATTLTENVTETIQVITSVQEWYSENLGEPVQRKAQNAFCFWRVKNAHVIHQSFPPTWPCRHEIRITTLKVIGREWNDR